MGLLDGMKDPWFLPSLSVSFAANMRQSVSTAPPVCVNNSDSDVLVMQAADQSVRHDASDPLHRA
jgi:hypothetical protein